MVVSDVNSLRLEADSCAIVNRIFAMKDSFVKMDLCENTNSMQTMFLSTLFLFS